MNESTDRLLVDWLREGPERGPREGLERALAATHRVGQRPGWTLPERWLPMTTITLGRRTILAGPVADDPVLAAVVLALAAFAAFVGADRTSVPAPFGVARNGYIAAGQDGDIVLFNPVSGSGTTIIGGPTEDTPQGFSRDGTRLAFARSRASGDGADMWVADADGRNQLKLATDGLIDVHLVEWSPDGRSMTVNAVAEGGWAIWILPTDGSARRILDVGMPASGGLWRPVDGREILFRGAPAGSEYDLYAVRPDGTGLRPVTASDWNAENTAVPVYAWSPDGTQVAFHWQDGDGVQRIYVVPADGGTPRPLTSTESSFVEWSPDGSMIAYYGIEGSDVERDRHERVSVIRADGSAPPVLGPALDEGSALTWAPDGTRLVIQL